MPIGVLGISRLPVCRRTRTFVEATHELFVRAAIQGQTLFAASGDDGAYDNNLDCPVGDVCSNTLSVDYPASDTAITAAGGTTLPGQQELLPQCGLHAALYDINIPHERVWGWDYLIPFCSALGYDPITCGIFPGGSGGGVSSIFVEPLYQLFLPGTQLSQPDQSWIVNGDLVYKLPGYYPGRNVPDISFNADPDTGYVLYYTSSVSGFGIASYFGGTSFVAPQLNGVSALIGQYLQRQPIWIAQLPALPTRSHRSGLWRSECAVPCDIRRRQLVLLRQKRLQPSCRIRHAGRIEFRGGPSRLLLAFLRFGTLSMGGSNRPSSLRCNPHPSDEDLRDKGTGRNYPRSKCSHREALPRG